MLAPVFTEAAGEEQRVYVGGAAGLLDEVRDQELGSYRSLIDLLERRRALLDVLAEALDPRRPFVRVGDELANPRCTTSRSSAPPTESRTARSGRSA